MAQKEPFINKFDKSFNEFLELHVKFVIASYLGFMPHKQYMQLENKTNKAKQKLYNLVVKNSR
jgi:hypothetical protein